MLLVTPATDQKRGNSAIASAGQRVCRVWTAIEKRRPTIQMTMREK